MNPEQMKSGVRYIISTFGGIVAGWGAAKGWLTADQIMSVFNSEVFIGLITSGLMAAWGIIARSNKNIALAADQVPGVKGVLTADNAEGKALAQAIPSATVVQVGTAAARNLAQ